MGGTESKGSFDSTGEFAAAASDSGIKILVSGCEGAGAGWAAAGTAGGVLLSGVDAVWAMAGIAITVETNRASVRTGDIGLLPYLSP
jgi:hypothetical protein